MKNDIRKANEITIEMHVNDIVYGIISDELDDMICNCVDLSEEFEKLYFAKRLLSVLENSDMPIRAAVGLLDNVFIVDALFVDKYEYIGESDTDISIRVFVCITVERKRLSLFATTALWMQLLTDLGKVFRPTQTIWKHSVRLSM